MSTEKLLCVNCLGTSEWIPCKISNSNKNICHVKCPYCKEDLVQCRLCNYNFIENNNPVLIKNRRSAQGYMVKHLKQMHNIAAQKRQKTSGITEVIGDIPVMNTDCIFDREASQHSCNSDLLNESEGEDDRDDSNLLEEGFVNMHIQVVENENKKEYEEADEYVKKIITDTDLDPNTRGDEGDMYDDLSQQYQDHLIHNTNEVGYSYNDFLFFDKRTEEEKLFRKGGSRKRVSQNQIYFFQKYQKKRQNPDDESGGFDGLVHRANIRNREDTSKTTTTLESEQVLLMLKMMLKMSGDDRGDLVQLHNNFMKIYKVDSISHHDVETRFPSDNNDIRTMMMDGAHSIMKNFPVQRVFNIGNHACVSLKETIRLVAGHGAKFNFAYDARTGTMNYDGLNGTKAVEDLLKDVIQAMKEENLDDETILKTNIGWIYFWSDSFLRCFIKQKENSVWVLTVTICPPEDEKSAGKYTFVLAMGKSGEDHTPVIEHFLGEYQDLMKGFKCYFGKTNDIGRMAVSMLTWNADRPERQSLGNTRKEGHTGKVSSWAVTVPENELPACDKCYNTLVRNMVEGTDRSVKCTKCFNWTLDQEAANQKIIPVDKDYPTRKENQNDADEPDGREPGQTLLGPVKLTTDFMMDAVKSAYNARRNDAWSKATLIAFLKSCNVKGSRIDHIERIAVEDRINGQISDPEEYQPKIWSLLDCFARFRLPDLPMHGLAHGIIPDVMDILHTILSHHKKYAAFIAFANPILYDVASFRLDYCKVKSLPKAAWVGENSMAYMRLLSYLYGMFLSNNPLCTEENETTQETVLNIRCMLNAFQALISVLMSRNPPEIQLIDNHLKLFLSSAHYLHKRYGSLGKTNTKTQNKDSTSSVGQGGKQTDKRTNDFITQLNVDNLQIICHEFSDDKLDGVKPMRAFLRKITILQLKAKCDQLKFPYDGMLKPEIQTKLFKFILEGSQTEVEGNPLAPVNEPNSQNKKSKSENMCWNRGNWLSFMANIVAQIDYLGALHLLW